nr:immunoglobulin light chain junction region [Macaca mulatta]MPN88123.1 immunoglobulin light chain junction region [Macaca mulatta]MPN88362.1 immunoglobulin light chain junction region [Macaca mulatta]MPN88424.1 immunoglobulin light chain junction region [Macaca mulatta]MPN89325.1 immunoglobulin light chain junction region [Macaca mulatta]
CMQALQTPYSC